MGIISASHVDVKNNVLYPNCGVRRSIVCLDVYGFEPLWKIMFQYFIGEAQGVCGAPVSGCVGGWFQRLQCEDWFQDGKWPVYFV